MAVKTASKRKYNNFDVGAYDEALQEVLSAKKSDDTVKKSHELPEDIAALIDDELVIEENDGLFSYEDVQKRSTKYAKDHEDAQFRIDHKKQTRKITRRKVFETIISIGLVILIGFFVMLLLYPQTEISELARDNSNLKDQINTVKREIVNAEENANGVADMDVIRAQAIALGMQDPNQNQVINLPLPNTDSLRTRVNYNSDGINDEAFRDSKDALAEYYANNPDK